MKPLYLAPPVQAGLGACLRPGGTALTERLMELIAPRPASVVLDAGCGAGVSMGYLRQRQVGTVIGLDLEPELLGEARRQGHAVARADLARLPLPDHCLDLVVAECVWNLTDRRTVLGEWARTLKPGGLLAVTDIYARRRGGGVEAAAWPVTCCFEKAASLATVTEMVVAAGFEIVTVEDHSRLLTKTAADFVFAHGSLHGFWLAVTGNAALAAAACTASAASRPGLFLLIARKITHEPERIPAGHH